MLSWVHPVAVEPGSFEPLILANRQRQRSLVLGQAHSKRVNSFHLPAKSRRTFHRGLRVFVQGWWDGALKNHR